MKTLKQFFKDLITIFKALWEMVAYALVVVVFFLLFGWRVTSLAKGYKKEIAEEVAKELKKQKKDNK